MVGDRLVQNEGCRRNDARRKKDEVGLDAIERSPAEFSQNCRYARTRRRDEIVFIKPFFFRGLARRSIRDVKQVLVHGRTLGVDEVEDLDTSIVVLVGVQMTHVRTCNINVKSRRFLVDSRTFALAPSSSRKASTYVSGVRMLRR